MPNVKKSPSKKAAPKKKAAPRKETSKAVIPITDRVKCLADLWKVSRKSPATFLPYKKARTADQKAINAFAIARLFAKVLNEGWVPNWNDYNERKWRPYFWMDNPGFRFYDSHCAYSAAHSGAGSGLCFKSQALSDYAAKCFLEVYKDLQCE